MRDFKGMKRQRGRNRKPGGNSANSANPNRSWDSQGPENIKVRGNAQTVYERYMQLARDASSAGDRVLAENYMQHAEHYFRVLRALQPQRPVSEIAQRELSNQGFDIDFEDESGAQAAAFLAAQQAQQNGQQNGQQNNGQNNNGQHTAQGGQNPQQGREGQPSGDRDGGQDSEGRGEGDGGNRRESRRERWERRKDEQRNRRGGSEGESEGSSSDADTSSSENTPESVADAGEAPERPARRPRRPREEAPAVESSTADALPGFLTRPTPRAVEAAEAAGDADAPAPRRRAPRRKVQAETADSGE